MADFLPLLAVPNVSEGRDMATLEAIAAAFTADGGATLLDRHSDADHHRAVFTLAGAPGGLAQALVGGAGEAIQRIDLGDLGGFTGRAGPRGDTSGPSAGRLRGEHPHVGAVDVVPVVYLDRRMRGAACAEALVVADRIGEELRVPVFLYGELTGSDRKSAMTRAELRRGGREGLIERMAEGRQRPDFGPPALHPTAGATLVAAREPLVAFNLELAKPATIEDARRIAGLIREGGAEGMLGLRAIGVALHTRARRGEPGESPYTAPEVSGGAPAPTAVAQVSMNVERPLALPLRLVLEAVQRYAEVEAAELVGLAPRAALEGFPPDFPMPAFDPERQVIENALGL